MRLAFLNDDLLEEAHMNLPLLYYNQGESTLMANLFTSDTNQCYIL